MSRYATVEWDSGGSSQYRHGADGGKVDLVPVETSLKDGTRVRRGPDWRWSDQDGGDGKAGTVKGDAAWGSWAKGALRRLGGGAGGWVGELVGAGVDELVEFRSRERMERPFSDARRPRPLQLNGTLVEATR